MQDAASRVRDEGRVFHVESFIVPERGADFSLQQLSLRLNLRVAALVRRLLDQFGGFGCDLAHLVDEGA